MFIDALDDLAVHKGTGRGVAELQLDAAFFLDDADIEGLVALQQFLAVIEVVAAVEHRERTVAEHRVQAALTGIEELADLGLGQNLQAAFRRDDGVNNILFHERAGFSMHKRHRGCRRSRPRFTVCPCPLTAAVRA